MKTDRPDISPLFLSQFEVDEAVPFKRHLNRSSPPPLRGTQSGVAGSYLASATALQVSTLYNPEEERRRGLS